jgi:hypothetical protein
MSFVSTVEGMWDRVTGHEGDKQSAQLSQEVSALHKDGNLLKSTTKESTQSLIQNGSLPDLQLANGQASDAKAGAKEEEHWYSGALRVAHDLKEGGVDELINHPLKVLGNAAIGAAATIGAGLVAPEIALAAGAAGIAYGAYELYKHAPGWIHDAKVVANPDQYSATEQANAHAEIRGIGAGSVDMAAGIAGGFAASAAKAAILEGANAATSQAERAALGPSSESTTAARTGEELASRLQADAAQAGYKSADAYAVSNLKNPQEINEFVQTYVSRDVNALSNLQTASEHGWFQEGTESAWKQAISQADRSAASIAESMPATGEQLAARLQAEAAQAGFKSTDAYAMTSLKNPHEITEFVQGYVAKDANALQNLQTATEHGWFQEGTQDAWKQAISQAEKTSTTSVEATSTEAALADAEAAKAARLAESIENNQGVFRAAAEDDAIVASKKQLYNVKFEQVTEEGGRILKTLENRVEGESVPQGKWIATRLDDAGQPVIEDGMTNSWALDAKKLAKTYQVTPEQIEAGGEFVAPTRVDGPVVHMTQLKEPITIQTPWGEMTGKPGDWLANYDFDAATGQAGKDYAIVSETSYAQTYEPVQ